MQGGLSILDGFERVAARAVGEGDAHRTAAGEMMAVWDELGDHRRVPESAVEKCDGWAWQGAIICGEEHVSDKIDPIAGGIHVACGGFQEFLVAGFSDWGDPL